jgi:ATP-dependent DNA helicase RecQ
LSSSEKTASAGIRDSPESSTEDSGGVVQPSPQLVTRSAELNPRCLCLDIETSRDAGTLFKIAAFRPDSGVELVLGGPFVDRDVREALDRLAEGALFVLGHNIAAHDLPALRHRFGDLRLHSLPVVDTLALSPIAFPQNPYHRLLKDYKLVPDSRNDPLRDARLALRLFRDEYEAIALLARVWPEELACHHFLMDAANEAGLVRLLTEVRGAPAPSRDEQRANLVSLLGGKVCGTRLGLLAGEDFGGRELALSYALAWLRVAGGNSVLPPWVMHRYPEARRLIRELRDTACGAPECHYCAEVHDPERELERHFGFDSFRAEPADANGASLQRKIVLAAMRGEHLLAILPTGGGKSLCYQLPALARYSRTGQLTIVISPLQSLMKNQVDNLTRQGIFSGAALNGLPRVPSARMYSTACAWATSASCSSRPSN